MNSEYYEKTIQKMYEAIAVIEGLKDLKEGKYRRGSRDHVQIKGEILTEVNEK